MLDLSGLSLLADMDTSGTEMFLELDLKRVFADPNQPRKEFDEDSIAELAADIKRNGLIQPIVVKQHPDLPENYLVVAGERRLRAVQKLKLPTIKAILKKEYTQTDLGYIQIAENLKRDDLKFYELAEFILSRLDKGETQEQIAGRMGINQSRVALYTSWRTAPDFLRETKHHFKSIKSFSVLAKLTQDYPQVIQDYVSKLEADATVSESEANRLKRQLEGAAQHKSAASVAPVLDTMTEQSSLPNPAIVGEQDGSVFASAPAQGALPSASGPAVSYPSFEGRLQPGSNSGDEQQSPQNDTEHPAEGTDQVQDAKRYRKPQILGMVDSRLATLLYREIAEAGCVIVKYQNGGREQILADRFRLKEISEAS